MKRFTLTLAAVTALGFCSVAFANPSMNRAPFATLSKAQPTYALTGQARRAVQYRWQTMTSTSHGHVTVISDRVIAD